MKEKSSASTTAAGLAVGAAEEVAVVMSVAPMAVVVSVVGGAVNESGEEGG